MKKNTLKKLLFFISFFALKPLFVFADQRPNIIIIFADDWGYGDLGAYQYLHDVKTPHLDALASRGVLFTDAYVTAPQCSPSRAGLMTGRYQQRFGFDSISEGPLPLEETTVATRLKNAGYVTGFVGKWHLQPNAVTLEWARKHQPGSIVAGRVRLSHDASVPYLPQSRGFDQFYWGEKSPYWGNYSLSGADLNPKGERIIDSRFRVDSQTEAGLAFVRRNADKPFLLYLAYFAPHVPLEATEKYLNRFSAEIPERRRTGLAMISAVDEGVGRIIELLHAKQIYERTLVIFTSDNGAPLGAHQGQPMADVLPVGKPGPAWDGSRNDPLMGEKGMLAEGGIRVPMIWSWPDRLPQGQITQIPVISLDITASVIAVATADQDSTLELDGVNIMPWLAGEVEAPRRDLFWRFWNQSAVRSGKWKLIRAGNQHEMLFNLREDKEERRNLLGEHEDVAAELRSKLYKWSEELKPSGLSFNPLNGQESSWYRYYFTNQEQKD